jgi:hypothetical protein
MNEMFVWWDSLDKRKRILVLRKIGASGEQAKALSPRYWDGLSRWVKTKLKRLKNDNEKKDSWQKFAEGS